MLIYMDAKQLDVEKECCFLTWHCAGYAKMIYRYDIGEMWWYPIYRMWFNAELYLVFCTVLIALYDASRSTSGMVGCDNF